MLRQVARQISNSSTRNGGLRNRMRSFVIDNPHLSAPGNLFNFLFLVDKTLKEPPSVLSSEKMKREMLRQIDLIDVDARGYVQRTINEKSTCDNPNLVPGTEERKLNGCTCFPDAHHVKIMCLYRDYPQRCSCGHWFKLITYEEFEKVREKNWNKIKDIQENKELMESFESAEDKLYRLIKDTKNMKSNDKQAFDKINLLAVEWKKLLNSYSQIRKKMNDF